MLDIMVQNDSFKYILIDHKRCFVKILKWLGQIIISFTLVGFTYGVWAEFTAQQKENIEQIVKDYLIKNPEVLIEVSKSLQQKQQKEMLERAQSVIPQKVNELFKASSPSVGKKDSPVHVVMWFDYQCVHCRQMTSVLNKLISENKNMRLVFKEFPIFGEVSEYASKMALAADKQSKYMEFHKALMDAKPPLTKDKIVSIAKSIKLDVKRLEKDMNSEQKDFESELKQNLDLAQELGIMGTPAFVIAGNIDKGKESIKSFFVPGASTYEMLQNLVKQASTN